MSLNPDPKKQAQVIFLEKEWKTVKPQFFKKKWKIFWQVIYVNKEEQRL